MIAHLAVAAILGFSARHASAWRPVHSGLVPGGTGIHALRAVAPPSSVKSIENLPPPGWKLSQEERYKRMTDGLLAAAQQGVPNDIEEAVLDFEKRAGKRAPARSKQILGPWRLAYAAPIKHCSCGNSKNQKSSAGLKTGTASTCLVLFGPDPPVKGLLPLTVARRCEVNGKAAAFRPSADNTLEFLTAGPPFEGRVVCTYLDKRIMILRRDGCGRPLLLFERDA